MRSPGTKGGRGLGKGEGEQRRTGTKGAKESGAK